MPNILVKVLNILSLLILTYPVFAANTQEINIELGGYYFKPDSIKVKVGQPVKLVLTNSGRFVPHNLVINAPDAGIDIKVGVSGGKTESVSFTPTRVGKYEMFCSKKMIFMKSHKDKGMHGTLEVVSK